MDTKYGVKNRLIQQETREKNRGQVIGEKTSQPKRKQMRKTCNQMTGEKTSQLKKRQERKISREDKVPDAC